MAEGVDPPDEQLRAAVAAHRAVSDLQETDLQEGAQSRTLTALEALEQIVLELALERWEDDA